MTDHRILIVDDDEMLAETMRDILHEEGFKADVAHRSEAALATARKHLYSLGIIDLKLPDARGDELYHGLRKIIPDFECILMTGFASIDSAMKAAGEPGIIAYETKPVNHSRLLALIREVFERKRAQEALKESEWLYRTMFQSSQDGLMLLTDTFTDCNDRLCSMWGYDKKEIIGRTPVDFSPEFQPDGRPSAEKARELIEATRAGVPQSFHWQHIRKDGEIIDFSIMLNLLPVRGKQVLFCSLRDISGQVAAEQAVRKSEANLRALSRRMISLIEDERARLARELHDELGQKLTGLFLEIECLKANPGADPSFVQTAKDLLKNANDDLKRIYHGLRPVAIDKLGLSYALDTLQREFAGHGNISVETDIVKIDRREIEPDTAIAIFRIAQEILNNIAKHSGARKVKFFFRDDGDNFTLRISDDGAGFDVEGLDETGGFGILGMRERAAQLGGKIRIESAPGKGATVRASFPKDGRTNT